MSPDTPDADDRMLPTLAAAQAWWTSRKKCVAAACRLGQPVQAEQYPPGAGGATGAGHEARPTR
ncbi:hypothetical protein, partial [Mycobacterium kansasii]|uniref:hypothetical protein n=1 Tax=Mycobacterium kansasii TaxID=1768 RepID=UPI001A9CA897